MARRFLLLSLAFVLAMSTAFAAAPPAAKPAPAKRGAFTLDHLLTLSSISQLSWSADGRQLAFVVSAPDTAENSNNQDLWLLDLPEGRVTRLTRHPKNDFGPTFSPYGDTLAFIANRATGDDPKSAIWMMSLRGGEPWAFGSTDESVSEVEWSPDGRWLAYVKLDTLPKQVREWRKKKWDHVVEDERLQYPSLWVTEVAGGKPRRLTSNEHVSSVRWSPDSKRIAFLVNPTGKADDENKTDLAIVPVEGGAERKLGVIGAPFAWSPDGKWLAWAGGSDRKKHVEKSDLRVVSSSGGTPVNLTASFDEDAKEPAWSPGSDTLYFHSAQGVTTVLAAVSRTGGPGTLGVDLDAEAGVPVVAGDGRVAWVQSSAAAPSEVWVADRAGLPGRRMTGINAGIADLTLGATRAVQWTSTDRVEVEGLLLRPAGARPNAPLKTLVLLHGGPYTARYALGFQALPQYFAAHGYQVFMPNFRSSGGYGTAFMQRQRSDWGFQDWQDVASGVDSLVKWGLADGRRLGVYGGSYGGYLSAWAITQTDRFDAACVLAGAVDLPALFGQSDVHQYRAFEFEGYPWETPDLWRRSSPITHILDAKTPTLIIIGENDARIPYPQGQQLYTALVNLGVPAEFAHYPREGHGLREPRHRADQTTRMLRWFDRWMR